MKIEIAIEMRQIILNLEKNVTNSHNLINYLFFYFLKLLYVSILIILEDIKADISIYEDLKSFVKNRKKKF